jgi:hypothetical protein
MKKLLTDNHEDRARQRKHISQAIAIYRSLLAGGVVEQLEEPDAEGRYARLTVDLQEDFALNQPLSTFALAAFELLDPASPSYALDVLSVIESILENPRQILAAQENKAKAEAVAQMKADGVEYEERMELLQDITYPKPLEDTLYGAYDVYRRGHPWVADHPLQPKSVVRDMYEQAMTFTEYVANYQLARAEGIVLRYLASAYKALQQTVPDSVKTEDLHDLIEWLGELVRQVDSSLLDEWEQLQNPSAEPQAQIEETPNVVTANERAFRVLVRNAMFRRVELAALERYDDLGDLDAADGWDADRWADALDAYFEEHEEIQTGPDARGPKLLQIEQEASGAAGRSQGGETQLWRVRQVFDDPAGHRDWGISAEVDLRASDEEGRAVIHVTAVDRL